MKNGDLIKKESDRAFLYDNPKMITGSRMHWFPTSLGVIVEVHPTFHTLQVLTDRGDIGWILPHWAAKVA